MADNTDKLTAAIFSLVMVLSVLALGMAGAGAVPSDGEYQDVSSDALGSTVDGVDTGDTLTTTDQPDADIDENLLEQAEEEERVTAVVRLEEIDRTKLTGDRDAVVSQLKSHAQQSQQPVVEAANGLESVEVLNQLWIANAVVVETNEEGLEALAQVPGVDRIHPNFELTIPEQQGGGTSSDTGEAPRSDNPDADQTYGLDMINAPQVWDEFDNQGEGAHVAILDTGYDNDHPDLPEIHPDDQWQEFDSNGNPIDSDPRDTAQHGTHVSGTVVGTDDPSVVDKAFGVAPEATIYHGLVIPGGGGSFAQVAGGMQYAVNEWEVHVLGMSLGAGGYFSEMIAPSENARAAGTILTASIGNGGPGTSGSPGNVFPNFASGAVDSNEDPAGFSGGEEINTDSAWGSDAPDYWPDNYVVPDAAAPGVNVCSTVPGGSSCTFSGTSMSQPHKAGLFALMVSQAGGEVDREKFTTIVEETARMPEGAPPEDPNTRYGHGIVDAYAAVSEVGPAIPEFDVGDANEDGEITIVDSVLIQQHLAGMNVSINENLADVDRDGEITIVDAVLIQQYLAGLITQGEMTVSNLDAPDSVPGGEVINVSADLENVGGMGMIEGVDFRLAATEDGLNDPNATLDTNVHDLAPAGSGNHTASTSYEIDTSGVPGGEYHHGVFSNDHNATDTITITQPFFEVTNLDAPSEADAGDDITVNTTIENTGNQQATQDVLFRFDPEGNFDSPAVEVPVAENLTLDAGESESFSLTVSLDGLADGSYQHGVFTDDDQATADIKVNRWEFAVSDVQGPSTVTHGDTIQPSATIENVGNATDTQTVEYSIGQAGAGKRVAIVTPSAATQGGAETVQTILTDRLSQEYTIDIINSEDLLSEMENYDTFVVLRFGTNDGDSDGDSRASDFYSQLEDSQGAIYMDTETGATDAEYSNAINRLHRVVGLTDTYTDDPEDDGKTLEITEDHPIFTGVGSVGDTFDPVTESGFADYASSWTGYDGGTAIADLDVNGEQAIGVSEDGLEVLLANVAPDFFKNEPSEFTDEGKQAMSNAVEFVATGEVGSSGTVTTQNTEEITLDPGESQTVEFNYTVTADDGIGSKAHIVESEDDDASAGVTVNAPDQLVITNYSAPAEAQQTDEITAEVSLEHVGTEQTTQDIQFDFGGGLLQINESVTMSPGDTQTVPITATIPRTLDPGTYTHTASVRWDEADATLEVIEGDPANFDVSGFDAPTEAGQQDTFNVSATVENTGDFEDTQTIEYDFDVDVGDDPGEGPSTADVALVGVPSQPDDEPVMPEVLAILEDQLDTNKYNIDWVNASNIVDQMGDYDVFAVYRFGPEDADEGGAGDTIAQNFLDNLGDDQGVVYMGGDGGFSDPSYPGAILRLSEVRGDPGTWDDDGLGEDNNPVEITQDHDMWNEVGSVGDVVEMTVGFDDTAGFDDYSGTSIGHSVAMGMPSMAFNDNPSSGGAEALIANMVPEFSLAANEVTEEGNKTMGNAVKYVASKTVFSGSAGASDDGIVTVDGQPVKISATEEVTLDGGESTTVNFEFQVPSNLPEGTYGHAVFSDDGDAGDQIYIFEQSSKIEVTGHFPEDKTIEAGDDLVTDATVVNNGDVAGEKDINLNVDSQIRDTVTVTLDPGEVTQVTLSTTMTQTGQYVVSVNGQDPQLVEVTDSGTASASSIRTAVAG